MATNRVDFSNTTIVIDIIGGKWDIQIISVLFSGTKRFNELKSLVKGIQPKILTECLQHLEEKGIINRKSYPIVPPRVEYSLTEIGKSLKPVLTHLNDWGMEYQKEYKKSSKKKLIFLDNISC